MEKTDIVRARARRWGWAVAAVSSLVGASAFTGWNLTRSAALDEARRAYAHGDLVSCLQRSLDHLQRRPWSRDAALLAANCLSRLDYSEEAEAYYRRARRLSLDELQIRAYGLARGPHPERAIPAYQEILRQAPEDITAMRCLAAVLLSQGNGAELLALSDRLVHSRDGEVIGLMLRGVVYHNDRNPEQAVAAFERVLKLDPGLRQMPAGRALFWTHFTDDLAKSGRLSDAGRYLAKELETAQDAELMNRLGETYLLQGDFPRAERCFRQAAAWDPRSYAPHLQLAKLALQQRRRDEALQHLSQARLLAPRQYGVLYNLASVYRQLGQAEEAARVQEAIKEVRDAASSAPRVMRGEWPRYAL
jgi:tetratricopeptide (TPR) repeat protein